MNSYSVVCVFLCTRFGCRIRLIFSLCACDSLIIGWPKKQRNSDPRCPPCAEGSQCPHSLFSYLTYPNSYSPSYSSSSSPSLLYCSSVIVCASHCPYLPRTVSGYRYVVSPLSSLYRSQWHYCTKEVKIKIKDTGRETQGYRDTGIQGHRDTGIQGQGYRDHTEGKERKGKEMRGEEERTRVIPQVLSCSCLLLLLCLAIVLCCV